MKQLMELASYTGTKGVTCSDCAGADNALSGKPESFELEHRNTEGVWVNLSKAELDR